VKKVLAGLALLLLAAHPVGSAEAVQSAFAYNIDVDSATVTYFKHVGQNGSPFGGSILGPGTIKTTGSSTTVAEAVAGSNPFTDIAVGDVLEVAPIGTSGRRTYLRVDARASAASITVDTAVDLGTGVAWRYWRLQSGTTVNDGWFPVSGATSVTIGVYWVQGDLDALQVIWQCRSAAPGSKPMQVFPGLTSECGLGGSAATVPGFCTYPVAQVGQATATTVQIVFGNYSECRVGLKYTTTDTSDAGANLEKVMVTVDTSRSTP